MAKKKASKKKTPRSPKTLQAARQARLLMAELDQLAVEICEYSHEHFADLPQLTKEVSRYIRENGNFHELVEEYNKKMGQLCNTFADLEDAEKHA